MFALEPEMRLIGFYKILIIFVREKKLIKQKARILNCFYKLYISHSHQIF